MHTVPIHDTTPIFITKVLHLLHTYIHNCFKQLKGSYSSRLFLVYDVLLIKILATATIVELV